MRVRVLFFGVMRDVMGVSDRWLEARDGATAGELVELCRAETVAGTSAGPGVWGALAVAVNQEYAGRDRALCEGDEVALLPPVSGGMDGGCDSQSLHV